MHTVGLGSIGGVLPAGTRKGLTCFPAVPECSVAEPLQWCRCHCNTIEDIGACNLHFSLLSEGRWLGGIVSPHIISKLLFIYLFI